MYEFIVTLDNGTTVSHVADSATDIRDDYARDGAHTVKEIEDEFGYIEVYSL